MTVDELYRHLDRMQDDMKRAIEDDLPDIIGVEAVNHFKASFENEGFTDQSLEKWPEVKRRQGKNKGADALRKILTGKTGNLHDSITYNKEPEKVIISANPMNTGAASNYAVAHNFGTNNAGRAHNTVIPKRTFLAHSEVLNQKIVDKIERYLKNMLKI